MTDANRAQVPFLSHHDIERYVESYRPSREDLTHAAHTHARVNAAFDADRKRLWRDALTQDPDRDCRTPYASWSHEELLAAQTALQRFRTVYLPVVLHADGEDPRSAGLDSSQQEGTAVAAYVTAKCAGGNLGWFSAIWADEVLIDAVVCHRLQTTAPVATALLRCRELGRPEDRAALEKAVGVAQLASYRPTKYSAEDLRGIALTEALKAYAALCADTPTRPYGPFLMVPESFGGGENQGLASVWQMVLQVFHQEIVKALADNLPLLTGAAETIPAKVRQALRTEFEKWKAQKRCGTEVLDDNAHGSSPLDAHALGAQASTRGRRRLNGLESTYAWRLQVREILARAERMWGPRASRFLGAVSEGHTIREAATQATISRQTAYTYLQQLRTAILSDHRRAMRAPRFAPVVAQ